MGEALLRVGNFDEAKERLERVRSVSENTLLRASASLSLAAGYPAPREFRWRLAREAIILIENPQRTEPLFGPDVAALFTGNVAWSAGHCSTAIQMAETALCLAQDGGYRAVEALAAGAAAHFLAATGHFDEAISMLERGFSTAAKILGTSGFITVTTLGQASRVHRLFGYLDDAESYAKQALAEAERHRLPHRIHAAQQLARVLRDRGSLDEAEELCQYALRLGQDSDEGVNDSVARVPLVRVELANVAVRQGRSSEAMELIRSSSTNRGFLVYPHFLEALEALGAALVLEGRFEEAATCLGAGTQHREKSGVIVPTPDKSFIDELVEKGRETVGATAWDTEFEQGRSLHGDDLLEEILHGPAVGLSNQQPRSPGHH